MADIANLRPKISHIFLGNANLLDHHSGPFNNLISKTIPDIIQQYTRWSITVDTTLLTSFVTNCRFHRPTCTPEECRVRGETYLGEFLVDVKVVQTDKKTGQVIMEVTRENVLFCQFPIMVFSHFCVLNGGIGKGTHDYPGTFIVHGKRRFIPLAKTLLHNYPLYFQSVKENKHILQIRSEHVDRRYRSTSTLHMYICHGRMRPYEIMVEVPFVSTSIPLGLLVLAMGGSISEFILSCRMFISTLCDVSLLLPFEATLRKYEGTISPHVAVAGLCKLEVDKVPHILHVEVLPHLNKGGREPVDNHTKKIRYLAFLTTRLILFSKGIIQATNRDCQRVARVTSASNLLAVLFRSLIVPHARHVMYALRKTLYNQALDEKTVSSMYTHTRFTRKIISALATGRWSTLRTGISQSLGITNDSHILSQLRVVASGALNSDGKHILPRIVHGTSFGYECAAETPEGAKCGLLRSLALFARLSYEVPFESVELVLHSQLGYLIQSQMTPGAFVLFGPGQEILGYTSEIQLWQQAFQALKTTSCLDIFVTTYTNVECREWHCFADHGRLMRPLLVLENLFKVADILNQYKDLPNEFLKSILISEGCIEYVDALRESNLCVITTPTLPPAPHKVTHMELNDVTFLGILASTTPLFRHNQGPRLVYWTSMVKQVIPSARTIDPTATLTNAMWYPQRPLVMTRTQKDLNFNTNTLGVNVIIAFLPLEWTQEDAILVNKAALDRGMFSTTLTRTYSSTINDSRKQERFVKPNSTTLNTRAVDYSTIQQNGRPEIGTYLPPNAIVIGKTVDQKIANNSINDMVGKKRKFSIMSRDASTSIRRNEQGIVTSVHESCINEHKTLHVSVADYTSPVVGDKFSSRHAQKGTIGHICAPENMPFSVVTGVAPDICMSPLGLTSRMTMGVLLEAILGKAVCLSSDIQLGIDEQDLHKSYAGNIQTLQKILHRHGFHHSGKEKYRDGTTGKLMTAQVMTGCMTYVKLNHLVRKKGQARSTGPIQMLNRQPTEGIARNGGLRLGTMEMECLTAHGGAEIIRERTFTTSDAYHTMYCTKCGHLSESNTSIKYLFCRTCQSPTHIRNLPIAYSTKLMMQELSANGIKVLLSDNALPVL